MSPETENFESLRRVLALKRHEVPPPGYFNYFSRDVIARIKAGERGEPESAFSWLRQLWETFEARPIFAGAFGAAVCALLVSAAVSPEGNSASAPMPMNLAVAMPASTPLSEAQVVQPSPVAYAGVNQAAERPQVLSSTNAMAPSLNSLFNQFKVQTEPAAYGFSGGN